MIPSFVGRFTLCDDGPRLLFFFYTSTLLAGNMLVTGNVRRRPGI